MNIALIGSAYSSKIFLKNLIDANYSVCGVIGKKTTQDSGDVSDIVEIAINHNIEGLYVSSANSEEAKFFLVKKNVDILLCLGWNELLDNEMINIPKQIAIGFHPTLLPHNKGRHPIIWALVLGLRETGSSFFELSLRPDSGKILSQKKINIEEHDNAKSLYDKILNVACPQLLRLIDTIICQRQIEFIENTESNSWRKRTKADGIIDFRMSRYAIYNLVRALVSPYPGALVVFGGKEFMVEDCKILENVYSNYEPGKVLKVSDKSMDVVCCDGVVSIYSDFKGHIEVGDYV